ncbi:hypothetical protein M5689_008150 [Euphorbia peplus]|nr:hypothetical protein M5689_008150 [Euphorbia peplus]
MKQDNPTRQPQGNTVRVVTRSPRSTTKERADICKSRDKFSIVMRASHLSGGCRMCIPNSFARKYLKKPRDNVILKSVDETTCELKIVICRGSQDAKRRPPIDDNLEKYDNEEEELIEEGDKESENEEIDFQTISGSPVNEVATSSFSSAG